MALDFLGPLRLFFNLALKDNRKSGMTNFNSATSALMKIIEGQYPNLVIPYHKVEFSRGQLMNILPSVHDTPHEINITWSNIIAPGASGKDTVMIIIYDEADKDYYVFEVLREDCNYQLIASEFPESILHIWTAVLSVGNSKWSNSEYCGRFAFGNL